MEAIESLLGDPLVGATRPALWAEPVNASGTRFTPPDPTRSQECFCVEWQAAPTDPDGCDEAGSRGAFSATNEVDQGPTTEGRRNTHGARAPLRSEPAAVGSAVTQLDQRVLRDSWWTRTELGLAPATELGPMFDLSAGSR